MEIVKMRFKILILTLCLPLFFGSVSSQDQIEIPSWEMGWETDMDGTYTLEITDDNDIEDELLIYIDNQRMTELNIDLTIEWDSSDIPIEIDYPESVTVSSSTNETIPIKLKNENDYVFERSPNSSMVISITADESIFEQSTGSQEIDGDIAVPSVYDLTVSERSTGEKLYPGSSIEHNFLIENNGNSDDAIGDSQFTIRSCPHMKIEGMEELESQVITVNQVFETKLKVTASEAHPGRSCEVTLSVTSTGSKLTSSVNFEIEVYVAEDSSSGSSQTDTNENSNQEDNDGPDLVESGTLPFISLVEFLTVIFIVNLLYSRRN